jgi:hypothetical protein
VPPPIAGLVCQCGRRSDIDFFRIQRSRRAKFFQELLSKGNISAAFRLGRGMRALYSLECKNIALKQQYHSFVSTKRGGQSHREVAGKGRPILSIEGALGRDDGIRF